MVAVWPALAGPTVIITKVKKMLEFLERSLNCAKCKIEEVVPEEVVEDCAHG